MPATAQPLAVWTAPDRSAPPPSSHDDLTGQHLLLAPTPHAVTLLHVFATWCEPCRAEMTGLSGLARDFSAEPLRILALSSGEPPIRVRRFFATRPVPFPVLFDPDKAAMRAYGVALFPTTLLIAADGRVLRFIEGVVDWSAPDIRNRLSDLLAPLKG